MKKNVRLVLLLAMIAVMIVMTAVFASAATIEVAADDDLVAIVDAAQAGDTILINGDVTVASTITLNKDLTFVGNGGAINGGSAKLFYVIGGNIVFQDVVITTKNVEAFEFNGNAVVEIKGDNTSVNTGTGRFAHSNTSHSGTVTIQAGKFVFGGYGWQTSTGTSTLNIYGGVFEGSGSRVLSFNNKITANIYGGTFTNTGSGDVLYLGDSSAVANVYGGIFIITSSSSKGVAFSSST